MNGWPLVANPLKTARFGSLTVLELCSAYLEFAEKYYVKDGGQTNEVLTIRLAIRALRELYGRTRAIDFGPLALQTIELKGDTTSLNDGLPGYDSNSIGERIEYDTDDNRTGRRFLSPENKRNQKKTRKKQTQPRDRSHRRRLARLRFFKTK